MAIVVLKVNLYHPSAPCPALLVYDFLTHASVSMILLPPASLSQDYRSQQRLQNILLAFLLAPAHPSTSTCRSQKYKALDMTLLSFSSLSFQIPACCCIYPITFIFNNLPTKYLLSSRTFYGLSHLKKYLRANRTRQTMIK